MLLLTGLLSLTALFALATWLWLATIAAGILDTNVSKGLLRVYTVCLSCATGISAAYAIVCYHYLDQPGDKSEDESEDEENSNDDTEDDRSSSTSTRSSDSERRELQEAIGGKRGIAIAAILALAATTIFVSLVCLTLNSPPHYQCMPSKSSLFICS